MARDGFFIVKDNTMDEQRIKQLEEDIAYLYKDILNLTNIIEALQRPIEKHYHYTTIINTKSIDIDPFEK
jgi:hypothetical protein